MHDVGSKMCILSMSVAKANDNDDDDDEITPPFCNFIVSASAGFLFQNLIN